MDIDALLRLHKAVESDVGDEFAKDPQKRSKIGGAEYQAAVNARLAQANVLMDTDTHKADRLRDQEADEASPARRMQAKRNEVERSLRDEFASDPARSHQTGGSRYKAELAKRYKAEGVHLESDAEGGVLSRMGFGGLSTGAAILGGITSSVKSGAETGRAMSVLAGGLNQAVQSAGGGFIAVGNSILSQILSPFGKSGEFASHIFGGIASGLLSAVGAIGGLGQAGLKIGGSVVGGVLGGGSAILGAGVGAILGSVIPGAGTIAGAVAGAGVFAALGGAVSSVITSVAGTFGQALSGLGRAFGEVGKSVADAIGGIRSVVSDLIQNATQFASATATLSRRGGFSEAAGSGLAAFSRILTGSPDGLNGLFSSFSKSAPYSAAVARGFGVRGVNGNDPLSLVSGAYTRYQALGTGPNSSTQKNILLNGLFGGSADQIGNLFDSGMTGSVLKRARASEQSGGDTKSALRLNVQIADLDSQIDLLRRQFLTKLLPPLTAGLNAFSTIITEHGSQIVSGLERIGQWFYVKFPSYVRSAIRGVFEFGKSFALALPEIAGFGKTLARGFILAYDLILPVFKGLTTAALGLAVSLASPLELLKLVPKGTSAGLLKAEGSTLLLPAINPLMADGAFDKLAFAGGKGGQFYTDKKGVRHESGGIYRSLEGHEEKDLKQYDAIFSTQTGRDSSYKHLMAAADKMNRAAEIMDASSRRGTNVKVSASDQFIVDVSSASAELHLRSLQDAAG